MARRTMYECDHCGAEWGDSGALALIWILVYRSDTEIAFNRGWTKEAQQQIQDMDELPGTLHYTCGPDCATAYFDQWIEQSVAKDERSAPSVARG